MFPGSNQLIPLVPAFKPRAPSPMDDARIKQLAFAIAAEMVKAAPVEPIFNELWPQFRASRQIAPNTMRGYSYTYESQFRERFGHLRPSELTVAAVEEWRAKRRKEPGRSAGTLTSAGTRNQDLKCLKAICAWAVKAHLIARNPMLGVELEINLARRETVHTPQTFTAIERHADRYMWALFAVSVSGGLRKQEMRFLQRPEIDRVTGVVRVRAQNAKNGQARFTVISNEAIRALDALYEWQEKNGIKSRWVFPAARDTQKPVSDQTITWRWNKLRKIAGISGPDGDVWLHDSRRTFSSYATAEIGMADTMTLGGWKSPAVMMDNYHRIPPKRIKSLRAGLDRMIGGFKIKRAK